MSDYICNIRCSYRQPSGYCGSTGGYETCQYRQLHSKQTNEPTHGDIRPIHSRIDHYELDMEKGTLSYHVIKTNADKIRSMTDEELAEWFHRIQYDVSDYYCGGHSCEPTLPTGKESWLDWLKEEAQCTSE